MNSEYIESLISQQRKYFYLGKTLNAANRIAALKKLGRCIQKHSSEIENALKKDLGKSSSESYMCEIGLTLSEISYMIKHLENFSKPQRVRPSITQFPSKGFIKPSPYGVVLIMSPWNYPFLLSIEPLTDALAAGNTAILKPSAYSPHTSEIVQKIVKECFSENHAAVITGGRKENAALLSSHFDYIFFTGSQNVGKLVMKSASEYLTPLTLELGGKSPCIVTSASNLKLAAKRIVFGKFLNCGQTCVAPDYVYCDEKIKKPLLKEIEKQIKKQYGAAPLNNPNYGKIINDKHFKRITNLMDSSKIVVGGGSNMNSLKIEPTVMDNVTFDDAVMSEEIFGPVLPVLTFKTINEAVAKICELPHPLALYVFTENKNQAHFIINKCGFGGGCINDTIMHLASSNMAFGGFGESGMGSYHGRAGFDTFSHYKSILDSSTHFDLPMRYQPYKKISDKLMRLILNL